MNAPKTGNDPILFSSALLLAQSEAQCVVDRRALRDLGIRNLRVMTSGLETARMLADFMPALMPDVIFCHERLSDMDGESFVRIIRSHPRLVVFPLVGMISSQDPQHRQRALEAGYSTVLSRPYTIRDMHLELVRIQGNYHEHRALMTALQSMESLAFDEAIEYYSGLCANNSVDATEAFYKGLQQLKEHEWNGAIASFQLAMNSARLRGEAQLGLAFAWKGKGDLEKCRVYLREACTTFIRARNWHRAKSVYMRLLREAEQGLNPLLSEAELFIRSKDYESAAQTLLLGYDSTQDAQLYAQLAKACLFTEDPQESANKLCEALYSLDSGLPDDLPRNLDNAIQERTRLSATRSSDKVVVSTPGFSSAAFTPCEPREAPELFVAGTSLLTPESSDVFGYDQSDDGPQLGASGASGETRKKAVTEERGRNSAQEALAPLPVAAVKDDNFMPEFFSHIPFLRDVVSIAHMTWKLSRKKKR